MQQRRAAGAGPVWPSLAAQGAAHAGLKPWVAHSAAGGDKRREKADGAMRGRYTRSRVAENHPASGPRLPGVRSSLTWSPVLAYLESGPRLPGVRSSLTWRPVLAYPASGPRLPGVWRPVLAHMASGPRPNGTISRHGPRNEEQPLSRRCFNDHDQKIRPDLLKRSRDLMIDTLRHGAPCALTCSSASLNISDSRTTLYRYDWYWSTSCSAI